MWDKCGTKILNKINKVKKSKLFFGSGIYPKKSVFVSFPHEMSGFVRFRTKGWVLSVFVSFALRSVFLQLCPVC